MPIHMCKYLYQIYTFLLTLQSSISALIRSQVTHVIRSHCQCEFQEYLIEQSVLICDELDAVVFRALIFSSAVNMDITVLVQFIEEWVKDGANITVGDKVLMFDPNFPVTDSSLSDLECAEPSPTPSPPTAALDTLVVAVSIVVGVVVLLLILVFVVIVIILIKRKSAQSTTKGLVSVSLRLHQYTIIVFACFVLLCVCVCVCVCV